MLQELIKLYNEQQSIQLTRKEIIQYELSLLYDVIEKGRRMEIPEIESVPLSTVEETNMLAQNISMEWKNDEQRQK